MLKSLAHRTLALVAIAVCSPSLSVAAASDAVLLEFSSENCRYCKVMQPVMTKLQSEGVLVRRVDVDQETDRAVRFNIRQLPTYVIVVDGKEASRMVGVQEIDTIRQTLQSAGQVRLTPTNSHTPRGGTDAAGMSPAGLTPPAGFDGRFAATQQGTALGNGPRSEPMPSDTLAHAIAQAESATVRLRVFEQVGFGVGTGTVIDRHGDEYLVLTCGHLFRDNKGQARVEVDLFYAGQKHTVPGQVIHYNADDRDIAVVSLKAPFEITPVPLLADRSRLRTGDSVFSFGCDRGADPSRRDTRITGVDKYNQHLGLSNIEIAGAPIDGRSGGGLFNAQGELIGVCNSASYDDDIGIYAGPGEVRWQLEQVGLTNLLDTNRPPTGNIAANNFAANNFAGNNIATNNQPASALPVGFTNAGTTPNNAGLSRDQEVIVIVRDRNKPQAPAQVKVFDQPPAQLLELIGG